MNDHLPRENCHEIAAELRKLRAENRTLKKTLREHTEITKKVIAAMDVEMKKPADNERGKRVGRIIHTLEFTNDSTRHFALGEGFPLSR